MSSSDPAQHSPGYRVGGKVPPQQAAKAGCKHKTKVLGSALLVALFLWGQDGRMRSSADSVPLVAGHVPSLGFHQ